MSARDGSDSSDDSRSEPEPGRGIARRGLLAEGWFASHGLSVDAVNLHLFTDEVASGSLRVARLWHTACALTSAAGRKNLLLIVQLEGSTLITFLDSGRSATVLSPGGIAVLPVGTPCRMESEDPVARIEIEIISSALPTAVVEAFDGGAVLPDSAPALKNVLTAAVHTALNAEIEPTGPSFPSYSLAVGHLAAGVLIEAMADRREGRVLRPERLFAEAVSAIAQRASDAEFTAAVLARELRISDRYLRKIFEAHGTSAHRAIRGARVRLARRSLTAGGSRPPLAEIARLAGFRSAQTLRAALRDTEDQDSVERDTSGERYRFVMRNAETGPNRDHPANGQVTSES